MGQWHGIGYGRVFLAGLMLVGTGCAVKFSKRSPWDIQQLQTLSEQLEQFQTLAQLKAEEAERLREAEALLEKRLSSEIASEEISVGFDARGLVVRLLDQVLFDSGKATLRPGAQAVLDKVARVLTKELVDQPVSIEGHTDNEPIKQSGWKDNWELSQARAQAVFTYLITERGVDAARVSTAGYGEERPIASNGTPEGRQQNRRVEIVALPRQGASRERGEATSATKSRK